MKTTLKNFTRATLLAWGLAMQSATAGDAT